MTFTQENTEDYSDRQLSILNAMYNACVAEAAEKGQPFEGEEEHHLRESILQDFDVSAFR